METLIGGLLGGLFRLAPEFFKWFDRKADRAHELAMLDKNIEADRLRGQLHLAEIGSQQELAQVTMGLSAMREALIAQGQLTGVRWLDALNISVRPVVTYWFMAIYCIVKVVGFINALMNDVGVIVALMSIWKAEDMALLAGILNFWFLGRVFEKRG